VMVLRNVREDNGRALLEMLEHLRLRRANAPNTHITVRVLAAADHDGICAAHILSQLLDIRDVKHTLQPVWENADIAQHIKHVENDTEVLSMVLLNCGASTDLEKLVSESKAPDDFRCFVIDAHRPIAGSNLSKHNSRIIVLDDDPIAEARGERPPVDELDEDDDADELDEDSEDDKENEGSSNQTSSLESSERKRSRREAKEDKRRRKRQRIQEYYSLSYHAMPASMSMFHMAKQAKGQQNLHNVLWLAALGLLGYVELGLMGEEQYNKLVWQQLKEALDSVDDSFNSTGSLRGTQADSALSDDEEQDFIRPRAPPKEKKLRFDNDLRLTLYKHWSLEESMLHSPYFYAAMSLHWDAGIRAMKNFFATAGMAPSEYRQYFRYMEAPTRRAVRGDFTKHGKAYGLTEDRMFLDQFVQDIGVQSHENLVSPQVSSLDAVHVLQALLCGSGNDQELVKRADGKPDFEAIEQNRREEQIHNFYRAYDAALCDRPGLFKEGVAQAVDIAKAVQTLARQIRDTKGAIKVAGTRKFRWTRIDQPPTVFRHQLAARKLVVWLSQTIFAYCSKRPHELPLLVVIRDGPMDSYLCVGITPPSISDVDEFGATFRHAVQATQNLQYRFDFFDKSCIAIAADDIDRFLTALTTR